MRVDRRRKLALSADHRRALELLAASPDGVAEALMLAHGLTAAVLADLVRAGLAIADAQRMMRAGGRAIEVTRFRDCNDLPTGWSSKKM